MRPVAPTELEVKTFLELLRARPWQDLHIQDVVSLMQGAALYGLEIFPLWEFSNFADVEAAYGKMYEDEFPLSQAAAGDPSEEKA